MPSRDPPPPILWGPLPLSSFSLRSVASGGRMQHWGASTAQPEIPTRRVKCFSSGSAVPAPWLILSTWSFVWDTTTNHKSAQDPSASDSTRMVVEILFCSPCCSPSQTKVMLDPAQVYVRVPGGSDVSCQPGKGTREARKHGDGVSLWTSFQTAMQKWMPAIARQPQKGFN